MRIRISHESVYQYDRPVPFGLQQLRLTPQSGSGQEVLSWETNVIGAKHELSFTDHHMNHVELISFTEGEATLAITSSGTVETKDGAGVVGEVRESCPLWLFMRNTELTAPGPALVELTGKVATEFDSSPRSTDPLAQLHSLSQQVAEAMRYESGNTDSGSTAEQALKLGKGVCQDHSHVFIACARLLGIPARYVSGYLVTDEQVGSEASHAWAEAYVPDLGWVGFDVSNGISPDERYVRVATGLDYHEAAPISGIRFGGGNESLQVTLQVQQ